MLKYPIGIQDFRSLREAGYTYVDKTRHIIRLLTTGKYYFFSRPRRFGKSLTVATMNELYSGDRELFAGLWAYDNWDFGGMRRPVVWLKFASSGYSTQGLEAGLHNILDRAAKALAVELPETSFDQKLYLLLERASVGGQVVLLIDEYDKPIIDYLDDPETMERNRAMLKKFYSVLKDSDPFLELVFITGVAAFTRVSIFSDLNNLDTITFTPDTNSLVGITQWELETTFAEALEREDIDPAVAREWYNGYSWTGGERVYNPFSLLSYLRHGVMRNYWFNTGTPTFLVRLMRNQDRYHLEAQDVAEPRLSHFQPEQPDLEALLFQTGYLTIQETVVPGQYYHLAPPNQEVKQSLELFLLRDYRIEAPDDNLSQILGIKRALNTGDLDRVRELLDVTLAGVPYDLWQQKGEHIFHALVHLTFSLLGAYVQSEVHTARGRCDALVITDDYIYAFEFKVDRPAAEALAQIEERGYLERYADDGRQRMAVGVSFDGERKVVGDWGVERV